MPDRVQRIQESPKKGSNPMVIEGSMKYVLKFIILQLNPKRYCRYDNLLLGKSPTDTYERDQEHLRTIISRAAKYTTISLRTYLKGIY